MTVPCACGCPLTVTCSPSRVRRGKNVFASPACFGRALRNRTIKLSGRPRKGSAGRKDCTGPCRQDLAFEAFDNRGGASSHLLKSICRDCDRMGSRGRMRALEAARVAEELRLTELKRGGYVPPVRWTVVPPQFPNYDEIPVGAL